MHGRDLLWRTAGKQISRLRMRSSDTSLPLRFLFAVLGLFARLSINACENRNRPAPQAEGLPACRIASRCALTGQSRACESSRPSKSVVDGAAMYEEAGASDFQCLEASWRTGGAAAVAAQIPRCLESNSVPQRACNGSARGPAVETRDAGKSEHRRAAAALRNASRDERHWNPRHSR